MNGYEFTQKVKEIDSRIKICFLAASEENYDYEQRRVEHLLTKPIDACELLK
jgi:CheY-like chemotaxis protein